MNATPRQGTGAHSGEDQRIDWFFSYPEWGDAPWTEPELGKLSRVNDDGSYVGGTVISLLRVMRYLMDAGHRVDFYTPTRDAYDVFIAARAPEVIEYYPDTRFRRKYVWLHDDNRHDEVREYRHLYDGAITVSPYMTSLYREVEPRVVTSTNPLEDTPCPRPKLDHLSLCFSGMFVEGRGVEFALKVLRFVHRRCPSATLTLYGSHSLWESAAGVVRHHCGKDLLPLVEEELGNLDASKVTFAGNIPNNEMIRRFADHHFLLVPSGVAESCSMVSIEAQCAGTVVIASANGALPDTVGTGGVCMPEFDEEEWAKTLVDIYADGWRTYSRRARKHFLERFEMKKVMSEWIDAILS